MSQRQSLYLCMGSACHQLGGFRLIPHIEELIRRHGLDDRIELKGAFCLEVCEHGLAMRFEGHILTGVTADTLEERFTREILPRLNGN